MSDKLDFSKLKFSDKVISKKEALKDIEPWIDFENENNLKILQQNLKDNMDKAVGIANKNTIRNEQGHVMISKDDEWRTEDCYDEIIEK